jgi:hypothetical protein
MRALPGRFASRISASTLRRVTDAAAAGQWEDALEHLMIALHARAAVVTQTEHEELCGVLEALNMPIELADSLSRPEVSR